MRKCYHKPCDYPGNPDLRPENTDFMAKTAQAITLAVADMTQGMHKCDLEPFNLKPDQQQQQQQQQQKMKKKEKQELSPTTTEKPAKPEFQPRTEDNFVRKSDDGQLVSNLPSLLTSILSLLTKKSQR